MNHVNFWVYELIGDKTVEDWTDRTDPGKLVTVRTVLNRVVVDEPSDNLCIYAHGKDGKHYQYDSYEAYHSRDYFQKDFDKHGLEINCYEVKLPVMFLSKFKV